MSIIFMPKYTEKAASSRYRTYQYLKYFDQKEFKVCPLFDDSYVPAKHIYGKQSKSYIIKRYLLRMGVLLKISNSVIFLEKEFFPYLPFMRLIFKLMKVKYIVDYDDAIFHRYDQNKNIFIKAFFKNKIANVIKNAKGVITGSPYLTEYALKFNKNVFEIPTSIDFSRYENAAKSSNVANKFIIGWIGSKTTSINLIPLIPVFKELSLKSIHYELRFIGFDTELENKFKGLPIRFIKWSKSIEIKEIANFSLGIMPLDDNDFNRGKCAFKLIQYMASGVPTISTPFESNKKVDRGNGNLFASTNDEWLNCFERAYRNPEAFKSVGFKNRLTVKEFYSIQSNSKHLLEYIQKMQSS